MIELNIEQQKERGQQNKVHTPTIITCGGGKGGIGKSTVITNIGTMLAKKGYSIGFVDADFGGANLHLCLGNKRPKKTMVDYFSGHVKNLSELAEPTCIPNTWLISGAVGNQGAANPLYAQKQKIIKNIMKLDADYVLIDLGAGSHTDVVDFFSAFDHALIVTDSLPVSLENAYGYIKNGIIRGILRQFSSQHPVREQIMNHLTAKEASTFTTLPDMLTVIAASHPQESEMIKQWIAMRKLLLVINNVRANNDVIVCQRFMDLVKKYVGIHLSYIGYCVFEPEIRRSLQEMKPITLTSTSKNLIACFEAITDNLIVLTKGRNAL